MSTHPFEGAKLDELFSRLHQLSFSARLSLPEQEILKILDAIHLTPHDEKEKLRRKDQALVNGIKSAVDFILGQDHMPQGTAKAFLFQLALLSQIEAILWELKGEKGPLPKPFPEPNPSPGAQT